MTKAIAQSSIKKVNTALANLNPTALITLFEIDISQLVIDQGVELGWWDGIFRFHNNIKLFNSVIYWQGNQYIAAPIKAEGFELTARGTLPTPKLAISVSPEGILALAILKQQLNTFDNLIGAKVTRIRTYAEHLDAENFFGTDVTYNVPDPNSELPRDIYFIDRKSAENKSIIEFQLASILDVEGVKLPNRLVLANRCTATYRCEGCLYEYRDRFDAEIHGDATVSNLPPFAPAVATERDELITEIINASIIEPVVYNEADLDKYQKGQTVFIKKSPLGKQVVVTDGIIQGGIPYYFVSRITGTTTTPIPAGPPDSKYWIADQCSKTIKGCKLRWKNSATLPGFAGGTLPFVGYPGSNRIK